MVAEKPAGSFCDSDAEREREIKFTEKILGPAGTQTQDLLNTSQMLLPLLVCCSSAVGPVAFCGIYFSLGIAIQLYFYQDTKCISVTKM